MAGANPGLKGMLRWKVLPRERCIALTNDHFLSGELFLTDNWADFPNQSMGVTDIEGVNEKDEMQLTDVNNIYFFFNMSVND